MIGQALGHYRIESKIGEGGMGVVYKAHDAHLDRPVAIKVLASAPATDREGRWRFVQEAKAASALNHPHIVHIYDVLAIDGVDVIVMEYVNGTTLNQLIEGRSLPRRDALRYAVQIADALATAHAAGIVHRDVKPGNIIVTEVSGRREGSTKLLDFGLAKLIETSRNDDSGITHTAAPQTIEGTILGTVAYMSPEQAEGKALDARSDIFSFGAVLYEMVTGRRAFQRDSKLATLSAILQEQPPAVQQVASGVPRDLATVITRCLRKDPRRRFQVMDDVKIALEDVLEQEGSGTPDAAAPRTMSRAIRWALVGLGLALVLSIAYLAAPRVAPDVGELRYMPLAVEPAEETYPSWSPDGNAIVYLAEVGNVTQIFSRNLGTAVPTRITSSSTDCSNPLWSPDGTRIYYISGGHLWSIGAAGGEPRLAIEDAAAAAVAPDGKTVAFLRGPGGNRKLWITSLDKPNPQQYRTPPFPETFTATSLEFSRDGTKLGVLIEPREANAFVAELWVIPHPTGTPRRILARAPYGVGGDARISWMRDGRHMVVHGQAPADPSRHLYLIDVDRGSTRTLSSGPLDAVTPAASPVDDRIAFASGTADSDLMQVQLDGSGVRTLLASSRDERSPAWSPTAHQLAYATNARGGPEIWLRSVRESWSTPIVTKEATELGEWHNLARPAFSPDGQRIAYEVVGATHTIWVSPATGGRAVPLDSESRDQHSPSWSPDGQWIAYQRLRDGKWEIAKMPLSEQTAVRLAEGNPGGGPQTAWSPTGEWIAYIRGRNLLIVSADGKGEKALAESPWFAFGFSTDGTLLYAVVRSPERGWELATFDVASGQRRRVTTLNLPRNATLAGFSLHPDGTSFATSIAVPRYDIWLLEGLRLPASWLARFW